MIGRVLLSSDDYSTLRREAKETLRAFGVPSNPGFSDKNIIDGLAGALRISNVYPEEPVQIEFSGEHFRDALGEILGLELPPHVDGVVTRLHGLME